MNKDWTIREELYNIFHQWPAILLFFAIGCAIGWAVAIIEPASYRAAAQIHVGLNPYRTFEDTTFLALARPKYSNVDDYRHWQMSQLDSAIYLDAFIEDTLATLQGSDAYWDKVDISQLRSLLDADWRSAGTWSLTAIHQNAVYAQQAAQAWSGVIVEKVSAAVQSARDTFMIDQKLQEVTGDLVQKETRAESLLITKEWLLSWEETAANRPQNQPLAPFERWQILSRVSQVALFTPAWETQLNNQPSKDALPRVYADWIDQMVIYLDAERSALQQQIISLEKTHDDLAKQYSESSDASLGLSPNIAIEGKEFSPPEVLRSGSLLALIGGVLGLCAWLIYQLAKVSRKEPNSAGAKRA